MTPSLAALAASDWSSFLGPLVASVALGGAIGLEREFHGRPAGLRTHVLVCVCSTMLIFASRSLPPGLGARLHGLDPEMVRLVIDPNRLGAGIVTGIGFLGAGTVIRSGDLVRGITTAACIWFVAGLGIVIGHESYQIATLATVVVLAGLVSLDRVTAGIQPVIYRRVIVRGRTADMDALSRVVRGRLESADMRVQDVSGSRESEDEGFELAFHVRLRDRSAAPKVLEQVAQVPGVRQVKWSLVAH